MSRLFTPVHVGRYTLPNRLVMAPMTRSRADDSGLPSELVAEAGGDRVGIKVSPEMGFNDIFDAAPQETYTYLVDRLRGLGLAYLHVAQFKASVDYRIG